MFFEGTRGLGLRKMEEFNQVLLMKLNWGLIVRLEALWVKVLRSKYSGGIGVMSEVKRCHFESESWKGVKKTWESLMEGVIWNIRDGHTTNFWKGRLA